MRAVNGSVGDPHRVGYLWWGKLANLLEVGIVGWLSRGSTELSGGRLALLWYGGWCGNLRACCSKKRSVPSCSPKPHWIKGSRIIWCLAILEAWHINFFQKTRFLQPWIKQPWVHDFKIESAVFPAENQPKISSAKSQPEKNSASGYQPKKMCHSEFCHKKIWLWGLTVAMYAAETWTLREVDRDVDLETNGEDWLERSNNQWWCVEESEWRKKSVEGNMATKTQMDRSRAETWQFSTRDFWRYNAG